MKSHIIWIMAALAVVLCIEKTDASPAATQDWVRKFIATNGVSSMSSTVYTNGIMTTTSTDGAKSVSITIEDFSVYALCATNVSASATEQYGITNDYTFVFRRSTATNGVYKTGGRTIYATMTNFVFCGISSTNSVGVDWFEDKFGILPIMLQPSVAEQFKENE